MRLLVTLGYADILFGATSDYALLLKSLEGAVCVSHDYKTNRYMPANDAASAMQFKLIPDGDISLPETPVSDVIEQFRVASAKVTELQSKVYQLQAELEKTQKDGAAVKSALAAVVV